MNSLNKRVYGLLMIMVLATAPLYGAENEVIEVGAPEQAREVVVSIPWYKERSTQIVAAAMTCVGIYTAAVYMNKFSSPVALWRNLFTPVVPHNNSTGVSNNNGLEQSGNSTMTSNMVDTKNDVLSDTTITTDQDDNVITDITIDTKNDSMTNTVSSDVTENVLVSKMIKSAQSLYKAGSEKIYEFNEAWNKRSVE